VVGAEARKGRSDGLDVDGNNKNGTETATSKPGQATHNTRRRGRAAREGLRVVSLLFLLLSPTPHPSALPSALLLIPSSTSILPPRSKAGEGGRKVAITSRVAFFSFSLTTGLACKIFISRVPNGELRRILSLPPKTSLLVLVTKLAAAGLGSRSSISPEKQTVTASQVLPLIGDKEKL
jgi:hypothetical protein